MLTLTHVCSLASDVWHLIDEALEGAFGFGTQMAQMYFKNIFAQI